MFITRILKGEHFQISYVFPKTVQNSNNVQYHDEVLNVFIMNDENVDSMKESQQLLIHLYSMRKRTDQDFWLLDATAFINGNATQMDLVNELDELQLDLDDDFYIFHTSNGIDMIKLFELYGIHDTLPKTILPYGLWSMEYGLDLTGTGKWDRRKNLTVILLDTLVLSN